MTTIARVLILGMLALCGACLTGAVRADEGVISVYVSPDGVDSNPGTISQPVKTLAAARDRLRKAEKSATRRMILRGGEFFVDGIEFNQLDGDGGGLVIESHVSERARLVNGKKVPLASFTPVTDPAILDRLDPAARGKVLQLGLADAKISSISSYPEFFTGHGGMIQLLQDDKRLTLSRWPDEGYVTMCSVVDSGIEPQPHGGTFVYSGDRPLRWKKSVDQSGVWLMGFWRVPWTIQAIKVASVDESNRTITFATSIPQGIGSKYTPLVNGTRKGDGQEPWYAFNLIEEITRPGEWCIDFSTQTLYLWPLEDKGTGEIIICDSTHPTIAIKSASNVRIQRIEFAGGLNEAVQMKDSSNITIAGCVVHNTGGSGIKVVSGSGVKITSCTLSNIGAEAIVLNSGVRETLTRGESVASNNHIHHTGDLSRTVYAVILEGVGNTVSNNLIHDAPIGGIQYGGNDHLIAYNEIHNIGLDSGDVGAIYTNGDWASRGNVIRGNLVHHALNVNGVYIDDGHSGDIAEGNIFYQARSGLFIGGGHDNIGRNNLIVECPIGIHLDDRGLARGYTIDSKGVLTRFLNRLDLNSDPWKSHYPALISMLSKPEALPRPTGNVLTGNVILDCKMPWSLAKGEALRSENTLAPNFEGTRIEANLKEVEELNFSLGAGSAILKALPDFKLTSTGQIGLQVDEYRPVLPSAEETGRFHSRPPRKVFDSQTDVDATNRNIRK